MDDILEFLGGILETLLSWRLLVSLCITAAIIFFIFTVVSDSTTRWVICAPIGIAGVILGLRWQGKAERI